jgi:hypothetical protein
MTRWFFGKGGINTVQLFVDSISSLRRHIIILSFSTLDILVIRHHFVEIPFQSDWSITVTKHRRVIVLIIDVCLFSALSLSLWDLVTQFAPRRKAVHFVPVPVTPLR